VSKSKKKIPKKNNYLPTPEEIEAKKREIRLRNEAGRYVMNDRDMSEDERYSEDIEEGDDNFYCVSYTVPPDPRVCRVFLHEKSQNGAIVRFRLQGNFNAHIISVREVEEDE